MQNDWQQQLPAHGSISSTSSSIVLFNIVVENVSSRLRPRACHAQRVCYLTLHRLMPRVQAYVNECPKLNSTGTSRRDKFTQHWIAYNWRRLSAGSSFSVDNCRRFNTRQKTQLSYAASWVDFSAMHWTFVSTVHWALVWWISVKSK